VIALASWSIGAPICFTKFGTSELIVTDQAVSVPGLWTTSSSMVIV